MALRPYHLPIGLWHRSSSSIRCMGEILGPCHIHPLFSPPRPNGLRRMSPIGYAFY